MEKPDHDANSSFCVLCFMFIRINQFILIFQLFPVLKEWGASGLLIEWEDTFPYSDFLSAVGSKNTATNAYSETEIEKIINLAADADLIVISLIQTFGHLEVTSFDNML